jgi:hypothetical protein
VLYLACLLKILAAADSLQTWALHHKHHSSLAALYKVEALLRKLHRIRTRREILVFLPRKVHRLVSVTTTQAT